MGGKRICVCIRLGDELVRNFLRPLADHPAVERLHLVRHASVLRLDHPKVVLHTASAPCLPLRLIQMGTICRQLAKAGEVDAVVSFNPLPYGLVAAWGCGRPVPYHLGFIGSDWYSPPRKRLWKMLKGTIQRASFITVTGEDMGNEISRLGADRARIAVLPHCIDLDRFSPGDPAKAAFDLVFVGQLIKRKRVDIILRAVAGLQSGGRRPRLCVVGEGPERRRLENMARSLGIEESVVFAGYSDNVERFLQDARVFVMASDCEGFPFAMVEAMCCGLVPVSTEAGTIRDHVIDGVNGFVVPRGDPSALASRVRVLFTDEALCRHMRNRNLELRSKFSYDRASAEWNRWLSQWARKGAT